MQSAPLIMGILNVTPDSFYDGGQYNAPERAVEHAKEMLSQGADIIDIGGESTGPGAREVSVEEELRRVISVIKAISGKWTLLRQGYGGQEVESGKISIDTYKAEVARQAIKAGATLVNDIMAGRGDPKMFSVIADAGCEYIMMRTKDSTPRTTKEGKQYDDVMKTIHAFFAERISLAEKAGIQRGQIIIDPGLGHFVSSDPKYSWEVLERLEELSDFGCRILVSPSRKSFTAGTTNLPPAARLENTLAATKIAVEHGANIIRTHDVVETKALLHSCGFNGFGKK